MRIAFILTALVNQGSISVFKELITHLKPKDVVVDLYYFDEKIENDIDCNKQRISFSKSLPTYDYDIVHSTGIRPDLYVYLNKRKFSAKTKFLTTIHSFIRKDFNNEYNRVVSFLASNFWYKILGAQDKIVVLTNDAKSYYSKLLSSPISVVNNGRTNVENNLISDEDSWLLTQLGKKYKIIGTHAKISKIKGLEIVIQSLVILKDYVFVVVGKGKDLPELKLLAEKLAVQDRCIFLGYRSNIIPFFKFYQVYVMPSRSEGLPMALIEAVANRVPCLCSDIPTFKEVFSDEEVLKSPLGDVDEFTRKIIELENPQTRESLVDNAFDKYLSSYTGEVMADNYYALYSKILRRK